MKTTIFASALISLCLCSCQKKKGASLEPGPDRVPEEKVIELQAQVGELRKQLVNEQNLRFRQDTEQAALMADMRNLLKEIAESKKAPAKVIPLAQIEEEKEAMDPNAEARRVSRLKAQGEKLAKLVTRSGAQYEDLVITNVTDLGVVFRHKGGIARVPFSDLDVTWQKRFYHDHDRAIAALKRERLAQMRHDRAVAANLKAMNEGKEKDPLDLNDIAQAVANINRVQPANTTIIEERIHVDSPIILNDNHRNRNGYYDNNGVYCPPVVRPPVVRTRPQPSPIIRPVTPRYKPTPKPTVRPRPQPTTRPTIVRPATPRPTTSKPAVQRSRPTVVRPTPQPRPARVRTKR